MRTSQGLTALGGLLALTLAGGCVSLAEYDQVKLANRTLQAEKEQLATDLTDTRSVAESLRGRVNSLEGEVSTKDQLAASLQQEVDRMHEAFRKAQGALENAAANPLPSGPVVLETKLPPALDSALKQFAEQYPSAVSYDPKRGTVKWKSDLLFALGSDVVREDAMEALKSFTDIIKSTAAAEFEVVVVGHTDDRPIKRETTAAAHPTNWHLSVHRSIAVCNVLQRDGYDSKRIGVMGYGEYRPVQANSSEEARAKNRRVEIYLIPRGALVPTASAEIWTAPDYGLAFLKAAP
ncbi:MAG TPA: OmpA family protein [Phycisphaerae bacterium]|jgi:chemotaxis protein MotB